MKKYLPLLLSLNALAQVSDNETILDVKKRFKPIERFSEARHINTPIYEYPYRPVTLPTIRISKVVQKALKRNAPIQNIKTFKLVTNDERVLVNVHELSDEKGFFYIVEKNGDVIRRVQMQFLEPVDVVTTMYEPPKEYVEIEKPRNVSPDDPAAGLISQFALRIGQTRSNWTADLLNDTRAANGVSTTLATNLLLDWREEFRLGATLQYETSTHNYEGGAAQYKNPSFGLMIQSPPSYWGGGPWRVGAQFRTGPFATLELPNVNGRPSEVKLRTTTIQFDWQYFNKNRWGEWSIGLAFQRDYPKIRRQTNAAFLESDARTNDQVGLFVTQGFVW